MVQRFPGLKKKGEGRIEWKKIRVPYYVLRGGIVFLLVAALAAGGSFLWARYRGEESFVGRFLSVMTKKIDERIKLMTTSDPEEEILSQRFATLTFYSGSVEVQRATELSWGDAREKMQLESGDRVRTFSNSRAEVTFDDGNVLKIKSDSLIVIGNLTENVRTKVRKSSVKLLVSNIEADIKKSVVEGSEFRVEMPTATAEIKKARFAVSVGEDNRSNVKVFEGKVGIDTGRQKIELGNRKSIMIDALNQLSKPENVLPGPAVVSPPALGRFFTNSGSLPMDCRWKAVKGASSYQLEIATDYYFDKIVFSRGSIEETSFKVPELGGNVFYFRVAAFDARRQSGDFSEIVPFRVIVDRVPPFVEVTKFVVLRSGDSQEVLINGQTEPLAKVEIGGRRIEVDESGAFSTVVRKFSPGQEQIEIVVRDRAGNVNTVRKAVTT